MEVVSEHRCFGGVQGIYRHQSRHTRTPMQFSVFVSSSAGRGKLPVLWFLSGLTCTEENFTVKSGAQKFAEEHGMIIVAPDTSPRGAGIESEDDDFGSGAGFYVDATQAPWSDHYRMYSYITEELQYTVCERFPVDSSRQGITGHSMGGHGALTIGLRNPQLFRSISAFSPICSPTRCPWGQKALSGYLGDDSSAWAQYDAVELIGNGHRSGKILVDQGDADNFLTDQLKPELLSSICNDNGQPLELRMQPGYDHSYYFISSFIADHIAFHASNLK
ncbi:MAG: S-formylglutathione hydrolase [Acidiferrobacterales bacterium]|nr:S-formylglutathione hydrolase [Acidiferrobacterales bacterium]